jgi:transcriptional regulator with XRE-family HTH domain
MFALKVIFCQLIITFNRFEIAPHRTIMIYLGGSMKTTRQLLGARIKEIRRLRELSQEQLAEKVGLDSKFISKIEVGRSSPSLETIENIARALEVEIRDLFEFMHLQPGEITAEGIQEILSGLDERTAKVIYKMLRAAIR